MVKCLLSDPSILNKREIVDSTLSRDDKELVKVNSLAQILEVIFISLGGEIRQE